VRLVRLRSAIKERTVLGVSGGVGRHEGALRDHPFSIASQRFENAMRQPRSVPLAGQLLRPLRVEQGDAAFSRRLRARRRRRAFQAGSLLDYRPRASGLPKNDGTNQHGARSIKIVSTYKRFILHRRLFARRRAGPLRSGTIAREFYAAPNIIPMLHGTNRRLEPTGPAETLSSRSRGRVN
jgi:hypothetical protein